MICQRWKWPGEEQKVTTDRVWRRTRLSKISNGITATKDKIIITFDFCLACYSLGYCSLGRLLKSEFLGIAEAELLQVWCPSCCWNNSVKALRKLRKHRCVAMPSLMAARWVGQNSSLIFRRLWTKIHRMKFTQAEVSVVCNAVFRPIDDILLRSGNIRDQVAKLSEITPKLWCFSGR